MSWYNTMNTLSEKCRFCGLELPSDPSLVITHFNNHWRQCNNDSLTLSSCAFESNFNNNVRLNSSTTNHEDLEVSIHMEPTFQYSYSPQTEPSNLTISGSRCSPLNLTGRAKSSSPLPTNTMPLPPQPDNTMTQNTVDSLQQHPPVYQVDVVEGSSNQIIHPMSQTNQISHTLNTSCQMSTELHRRKQKCNEGDFHCESCNKMCPNKESLMEHLHTHNTLNSQYLTSAEQIDMNQTVDNVIGSFADKSYQCSVCDREFTYREELLEHIENYEAAKPYKCDICGIGISSLSALKRHKVTHTGNKPHRCQICNRSFFQKFDLQRHQTVHKKIKQYECPTCNKNFTSTYGLKKHKCVEVSTSGDTEVYKCNICGRTCANNMAWSYHMWKHTKNAVFVPVQNKLS